MANYLIGIDVGTSSCKIVVINDNGNLVDSSRYEYPITSKQYGWAEQNPEDWYQAFKSGLKDILTRNPDINKNIAAIGQTGQMVSLNLLDRECKVIHPTIIWMDQRCLPQVNYLDKNYKKFLSEITFNPVGVQHTLPKILWVKENLPDIWNRVYKIQLSKDYIRFRLTGEWYTEYSDASATMLMDVKNLKWSDQVIDTFKIERPKLPDLLPSMSIAGHVSKTASEDLGIKKGIPVVAGAGDLAAENFAAGVTNFRQMATRLGTVANICTVVDKPMYYSGYFSTCCAYCIPGKWTLEVYDQAFGLCEKWYRDTFFKEEKERLKKENKDVYSLMDDMASEVSIGSEGLFFHPFVTGSPYFNPNLRGSFYGITSRHDKRHFTRAVLEGSAFGLKDTVAILDKMIGSKCDEYTFVGGGSKSELWTYIICNIIRKNAHILKTVDAAMGAAMLAGVGTSIFKDVNEAISKCVKREKEVLYNERDSKKYEVLYRVYKEIHDEIMQKSDLINETLIKISER